MSDTYAVPKPGTLQASPKPEWTAKDRQAFGKGEVAEPEEMAAEELEPSPAGPTPHPEPPPESAAPRLPSLARFLVPLVFLLIPLLNFLLRDSPFLPRPRPLPVLRQTVFCEGVRQGLPVNPQSAFSLRDDRQVVFYSRWSGFPGDHVFSLRWYAPEGNLHRPTTLIRHRLGAEEFSSYAFLPLEAGMPLGQWRVEVTLNQEVRARLSFELRE